jgi:hypothetical protein
MTVQLQERTTERTPGPLPTLGPVERGDRAPTGAGQKHAGPDPLLLNIRNWFSLAVCVSLPFIAYVLCSKAGFDLTVVTYPVLVVAMAAAVVVSWTAGERGHRMHEAKALRMLAVQAIPVAGFLLWRFGATGSYRLIPLFAVSWVFVATVSPLRQSTSR